ncbi:FAD-binding and (Fe-S)-binding domain-containing protein [uncultured Salinibacterium sp.]|uniref:FAD-binding and (Fe-S)-binding domain-containing protein n=1 Tax=uncultured Salinibacterium sp. TaxID=459274 RepID=UPI0030D93905
MIRPDSALPESGDIVNRLAAVGVHEVDVTSRRRAEYSSDSSNYRIVPSAVAFPRSAEQIASVVDVARELELPLTMRGAGTSVAGNSIGPGIVLDSSRHLGRVLDIDPEARTAVVEPGATLGAIQAAARPFGLRFGPDPSTWARCTIGGSIGNNACGPRALAYGSTAQNVLDLDVVTGSGARFRSSEGISAVPGLDEFVRNGLATVRTEFGRFGRQLSGYSLEHLLPENGGNLTRALVGSEGTLAAVVQATVQLVAIPENPSLIVLGYDDMPSAADDVLALLAHKPHAIEGLDARLVDAVIAARGATAVPALPRGRAWLLVEIAENGAQGLPEQAAAVIASVRAIDAKVLSPGSDSHAVWRIREDGAGLAGRSPSGRAAWPGLEDAAVPPEHLGDYLRAFEKLCSRYDITGMPYGHFGDGCLHVRLDFPLEHDGAVLRAFMEDAAELVASFGGSLSGEHGDGRARSELLPAMYSANAIDLFRQFKKLFDPSNIMNPGVLVSPDPIDSSLRRPVALPLLTRGGFGFDSDGGDVTTAVHRCVGVGKCRADNTDAGSFMCPSFLATRDEKDSTRARARVLQEMTNGSFIKGGWSAPEVADSLDLCLSCKACGTECPAGVDMATLKSQSLYERFKGKLRPRAHYSLGWMPRWARLGSRFGSLANFALRLRVLEKFALWAGGMDTRRSIPTFSPRPYRDLSRDRRASASVAATLKRPVVMWTDSFSDNFDAPIATAMAAVLEAAGYSVVVPERSPCCGLTWVSTGQLDGARSRMLDLVNELKPYVAAGIPVVGIEPSCIATVRSDLVELLDANPDAKRVAGSVMTLAELLHSPVPMGPGEDWSLPDLSDVTAVVQPHCHHNAVMGFELDRALLEQQGAEIKVLGGCCGLAGNFGMEAGHYEVSVAVAENALLPALREQPDAVLLADGMSCRTQAKQLGGIRGVHLAELIAERLDVSSDSP